MAAKEIDFVKRLAGAMVFLDFIRDHGLDETLEMLAVACERQANAVDFTSDDGDANREQKVIAWQDSAILVCDLIEELPSEIR